MTTDNRTNEELATRLRQIAESQAMDFDSPHVAMTLNEVADRLSRTATETQVEAAAKAWDEGYWQGINGYTGPGNPYRDDSDIVNRKEKNGERTE